jgi:two-component system, NarL family, response regulator DevR
MSTLAVPVGCRALHVFLVEDSDLIRERLCAMLGGLRGVEVVGYAATAADAIAALPQLKPDVAVLDIKLKAGSGMEVLRAIKHLMPALDVIVLTNYATEEYRKRCLQAGAEYFLDKTNEFDQLPSILGLLGRSKT